MADIQHTQNRDNTTTNTTTLEHAYNLGYTIRGLIDELQSDPLQDHGYYAATEAISEALINADPAAPTHVFLEAAATRWVELHADEEARRG